MDKWCSKVMLIGVNKYIEVDREKKLTSNI